MEEVNVSETFKMNDYFKYRIQSHFKLNKNFILSRGQFLLNLVSFLQD